MSTCSSADLWTGLKIDQVTVKVATAPRAKVNAASVSATASSTEARGTKSTTDR